MSRLTHFFSFLVSLGLSLALIWLARTCSATSDGLAAAGCVVYLGPGALVLFLLLPFLPASNAQGLKENQVVVWVLVFLINTLIIFRLLKVFFALVRFFERRLQPKEE